MIDLGVLPYLWIKAIHIVFVITWMAGLLYLPRLFVYHSVATPQSEKSETFKVMERRLVRGIMVPSLFIVIASGGFLLASSSKEVWLEGWVICKILLVGLLVCQHVLLCRWQKAFAVDKNCHTAVFYRWVNEVPAVVMMGIVVLVVIKPF